MKNKILRLFISFILILLIIPTLGTVAISKYDITTNHKLPIIDAFIIKIIKNSRKDQQFGIIYFIATLIYTTQLRRFYSGKMEINNFRGIINSSFICRSYNYGWLN